MSAGTSSLGIVARPSREFGKVRGPEFGPDRRLVDLDAEFPQRLSAPDPCGHHRATPWITGIDRFPFDHVRQRLTLRVVQLRPVARRLAVDQPVQTAGVEPHHPVPIDLHRHIAEPGGIAARAAVANPGQRQKAPSLDGVFRCLCGPPEGPSKSVRSGIWIEVSLHVNWNERLPVIQGSLLYTRSNVSQVYHIT